MAFKESAGNGLASNAKTSRDTGSPFLPDDQADAGAAGAEHVPARSAPTDRM